MKDIGLYLHTPFCASKCAYCDFCSFVADEAAMDRYTDALCRELAAWGDLADFRAGTVYLGGGTPSLLGGDRLSRVLEAAAQHFHIAPGAEITLEANPADDLAKTLAAVKKVGVNRLSLGVQSGIPGELHTLGRRHTLSDVRRTAEDAAAAGIDNLSVDLMLGVPGQTGETLLESVDFLTGLSPRHISAYLLKIEEGTPFFERRESLSLPEDDAAADLYLAAVRTLAEKGYAQYEISNFARPGFESRHNLKYWNGEDYLGLGPSAHSFLRGVRFYYPRDVKAYISGGEAVNLGGQGADWVLGRLGFPRTAPSPVPPRFEGAGGDAAEYAMLRLRLADGLNFALFRKKYGRPPHNSLSERAAPYLRAGYMELDEHRLRFTPEGFLLSNPILTELLDGEV